MFTFIFSVFSLIHTKCNEQCGKVKMKCVNLQKIPLKEKELFSLGKKKITTFPQFKNLGTECFDPFLYIWKSGCQHHCFFPFWIPVGATRSNLPSHAERR